MVLSSFTLYFESKEAKELKNRVDGIFLVLEDGTMTMASDECEVRISQEW